MSRKRRKRQSLFILDGPASAALIRQRLASRQWWAFIIVHFTGLPFVEDLESRYYSGKAANDFEMLGIPHVAGIGVVGIGLARKRRLSVRELARHFDAAGMVHEAETLAKSKQDVIVLADSMEAFQRVQTWLTQLVKGEPVGAR